jgi:tetratricopeptide (TPR) repeat protein
LRAATTIAQSRTAGSEAKAVALRAAGLALAELHQPADALRRLRRSARIAQSAGLLEREGEARMSAAWVLFTMGQTGPALGEADRAESLLDGASRYRLLAQRAAILHGMGSIEAAEREYGRALAGLVRLRDRFWEGLARNNRGVLYASLNQLGPAARDLERAGELFRELGMGLAAAHIEHNLGFLAAREGDALAALARYQRAEEAHHSAGVPPTLVLITRAELLLSLRMVDEAADVARRAVELCRAARRATDLAHARLVLAESVLLAGEPEHAAALAEQALRGLRRQGRTSWALAAQWVRLQGRITAAARPEPPLLRDCRQLAGRLSAAGWDHLAVEARIQGAQLAVQLGRVASARAELREVGPPRRRLAALTRARAWYARALHDYLSEDMAGARRALRRGVQIVQDYGTALGSLDLRAGVASHIAELTGLGVRMAVEADQPASALHWSELGRGLTLHTRPGPPPEGELGHLLTELRTVIADLRAAAAEDEDPRPLIRRQASIEEKIRDLGRQARPDAAAGLAVPGLAQLQSLLDGKTLVGYLECEAELYGIVLDGARVGLRSLGDYEPVSHHVAAMLAALRRLSGGQASPPALDRRRGVAEQTAARLQDLLVTPLGLPPDGSVVIVPTGSLHSVPWSALPMLADRPVTVTPSATLWADVSRQPMPAGTPRVGLIEGPELPGARAEVAELAATLPQATLITGEQATVAATLSELDRGDVVHIACHGGFRPENPLFSGLRLADGPLTGYDLQRLHRVPGTVVLSACDAGRSAVSAGEGLLGLAATLLSLGARTLVAPLVPVPDQATRPLMVGFHRRLASGLPANEALQEARADLPDDVPGYVTRVSFSCLGHG